MLNSPRPSNQENTSQYNYIHSEEEDEEIPVFTNRTQEISQQMQLLLTNYTLNLQDIEVIINKLEPTELGQERYLKNKSEANKYIQKGMFKKALSQYIRRAMFDKELPMQAQIVIIRMNIFTTLKVIEKLMNKQGESFNKQRSNIIKLFANYYEYLNKYESQIFLFNQIKKLAIQFSSLQLGEKQKLEVNEKFLMDKLVENLKKYPLNFNFMFHSEELNYFIFKGMTQQYLYYKVTRNQSQCLCLLKKLNDMIENTLESTLLIQNCNLIQIFGQIMQITGNLYLESENYQQANTYFEKSLDFYQQSIDKFMNWFSRNKIDQITIKKEKKFEKLLQQTILLLNSWSYSCESQKDFRKAIECASLGTWLGTHMVLYDESIAFKSLIQERYAKLNQRYGYFMKETNELQIICKMLYPQIEKEQREKYEKLENGQMDFDVENPIVQNFNRKIYQKFDYKTLNQNQFILTNRPKYQNQDSQQQTNYSITQKRQSENNLYQTTLNLEQFKSQQQLQQISQTHRPMSQQSFSQTQGQHTISSQQNQSHTTNATQLHFTKPIYAEKNNFVKNKKNDEYQLHGNLSTLPSPKQNSIFSHRQNNSQKNNSNKKFSINLSNNFTNNINNTQSSYNNDFHTKSPLITIERENQKSQKLDQIDSIQESLDQKLAQKLQKQKIAQQNQKKLTFQEYRLKNFTNPDIRNDSYVPKVLTSDKYFKADYKQKLNQKKKQQNIDQKSQKLVQSARLPTNSSNQDFVQNYLNFNKNQQQKQQLIQSSQKPQMNSSRDFNQSHLHLFTQTTARQEQDTIGNCTPIQSSNDLKIQQQNIYQDSPLINKDNSNIEQIKSQSPNGGKLLTQRSLRPVQIIQDDEEYEQYKDCKQSDCQNHTMSQQYRWLKIKERKQDVHFEEQNPEEKMNYFEKLQYKLNKQVEIKDLDKVIQEKMFEMILKDPENSNLKQKYIPKYCKFLDLMKEEDFDKKEFQFGEKMVDFKKQFNYIEPEQKYHKIVDAQDRRINKIMEFAIFDQEFQTISAEAQLDIEGKKQLQTKQALKQLEEQQKLDKKKQQKSKMQNMILNHQKTLGLKNVGQINIYENNKISNNNKQKRRFESISQTNALLTSPRSNVSQASPLQKIAEIGISKQNSIQSKQKNASFKQQSLRPQTSSTSQKKDEQKIEKFYEKSQEQIRKHLVLNEKEKEDNYSQNLDYYQQQSMLQQYHKANLDSSNPKSTLQSPDTESKSKRFFDQPKDFHQQVMKWDRNQSLALSCQGQALKTKATRGSLSVQELVSLAKIQRAKENRQSESIVPQRKLSKRFSILSGNINIMGASSQKQSNNTIDKSQQQLTKSNISRNNFTDTIEVENAEDEQSNSQSQNDVSEVYQDEIKYDFQ